MRPSDSIFLIGPMGAGKSAVGHKLAAELGREFIDSDEVIEARTGVDIPYIFEREGEAGFRARERQVIDELTQRPGVVLATGGGAVQDAGSRALLGSRGRVVYLHASVEHQLRRIRSSKQRPMLKGGDPREILEALMALRDPQFREIADVIVETDGRRVAAVTREICRRLDELEQGGK
ncbi:MAG: shikimate kinase AroK [Gammaproteobacteria bacterium]|nr:shikimate kinase AroK [Gammaproteobacteria bacterium]